jgi:hypothetical protein
MVGACIIPPPLFGKLNKLLKSRKALAKTFQSFPQEKKQTDKQFSKRTFPMRKETT